ncbi:unnamed protein product [Trifolium pratense]|uniref:Uncharacterized protein n=1 Tax=Trifolium pratense TaxID=57577 RepID=A0ACB0KA44_TRIPR|nr:unnamed protein product [Trifolium pratense]
MFLITPPIPISILTTQTSETILARNNRVFFFAPQNRDSNPNIIIMSSFLRIVTYNHQTVSASNQIGSGTIMDASEVAEDIKVLTWKWSAHKLKIAPCLYYEWTWDPVD